MLAAGPPPAQRRTSRSGQTGRLWPAEPTEGTYGVAAWRRE
jgi:hypothetical protein